MESKSERGEELDWLREEIDECDRGIIRLLARRFELVSKIGRYKAANGLPVLDEARESELIAERKRLASEKENYRVEEIFRLLLEQSRQLQERLRASRGQGRDGFK